MDKSISIKEVRQVAEYVIYRLPDFWKELRTPQVPRICEEISWAFVRGGTVVDIGGSSGFHTSICACLGMKAICVDNFKIRGIGYTGDHFYEYDLIAEKLATELGVEFIHVDILDWDPPFQEGTIDVVMSFDNIEHLHHSPRKIYRKLIRCLKSGGVFILGSPNAANLFKRVRVPLGKNIFAKLEDWYMHERFLGHVREPIVSDLLFIAKDLDLKIINIFGRNSVGINKLPRIMRLPGKMFDKSLRLFPSLCSDIYIIAIKSN
jgi:SAM-dependent methyltransferase